MRITRISETKSKKHSLEDFSFEIFFLHIQIKQSKNEQDQTYQKHANSKNKSKKLCQRQAYFKFLIISKKLFSAQNIFLHFWIIPRTWLKKYDHKDSQQPANYQKKATQFFWKDFFIKIIFVISFIFQTLSLKIINTKHAKIVQIARKTKYNFFFFSKNLFLLNLLNIILSTSSAFNSKISRTKHL